MHSIGVCFTVKRAAAQSQNQPPPDATRRDLAHPNCMNAMQAIDLACAVITPRGDDGMPLAPVSFLLLPLLMWPPLLLLVLVLAIVVMSTSIMMMVASAMIVVVVIQHGGRHNCDD